MKNLKYLVLVFMSLTLFMSCEKENTDIEIIESQLKDFISEHDLSKCTIIVMGGESPYRRHTNVDFSISNGFVVIQLPSYAQERYNLLYLSNYRLDADGDLVLYFSGIQ